jgi:hypothetical protein
MPPKAVLQFTSGITVACVAIYFAVAQPKNIGGWIAPIGIAAAISMGVLWIFDRFLWRYPGFRLIFRRPQLHGTWHGTLSSDWIDPSTDERVAADPCVFLVIRQRFWHVSARLITRESASRSLVASLSRDEDGVFQLVYLYSNQPRPGIREGSHAHFGGVLLNAPLERNMGLEGQYFTARKTGGEIKFTEYFEDHIESFAAGLVLLKPSELAIPA